MLSSLSASAAVLRAPQHRRTMCSAVDCAISANVYISEGRSAPAMAALEAAARTAAHQSGTALAHVFLDSPYHRSNYTYVARSPGSLAAAVVALSRAALQLVDLRQHCATHPRLGAVDHVSCHPLTAGAVPAAAAAARDIAAQLGSELGLPVFTYGDAHPQGRALADVRRELGYFRGAVSSQWQGPAAAAAGELSPGGQLTAYQLPVQPCYGPPSATAAAGVSCVGAVPLVTNFNVLLHTDDLAAARSIARAVSQRGGGLPGVQAMALLHEQGIEVACNLLDSRLSSPADVLERVAQLAAAAGLPLGMSYTTGKTAGELLELAAGLHVGQGS